MEDKKGRLGLEEVIKSAREKIEQKQNQKKKEQAKYDQRVNEFWENEHNLYEQKKVLYSEILMWRDQFVVSQQCTEIFDLWKSSHRSFLIIFGGRWGHKMDGDAYGCWSRVILDKEGKLEYQSGYKWMGINETITLKKDPEITQKLTYQYLQRFHDCLHSDEVYERIKEEVKSVVRTL